MIESIALINDVSYTKKTNSIYGIANTMPSYKKKTMKNLILSLLLIVCLGALNAQNYGEIHGTVVSYETGETLPQATVITRIGGEIRSTICDNDGRFRLKPLQPGKYALEFSYTGYEPRVLADIEVTPNKIYVLGKVALSSNNTLPGVEIVDFKLIDVDQPSAIVVKAADIRFNPLLKNPAKLIGHITSELRTDENGEFIVKGGRPGTTATFLDGVRLTGPLQQLPGNAIKSITVHTGGIPAKYGDVTGGIVVIETKSYFDYFYEYNGSR